MIIQATASSPSSSTPPFNEKAKEEFPPSGVFSRMNKKQFPLLIKNVLGGDKG